MKVKLPLHRAYPVLGLVFLFLFLTARTSGQSGASPEQDLSAYVQQIRGDWIDEGAALTYSQEPDFCLKIDPGQIQGDEIQLVIGAYCQPGIAQFLHFRYQDEALYFTGATLEGCFFDLHRIDFIRIHYEVEKGDTVLIYEAREVEYENHEIIRLLRPPSQVRKSSPSEPFLALLESRDFDLYDPDGKLLALEPSQALVEELSYYEKYAALWPDMDLLCSGSGLDLITLGGLYPSGHATVFALEQKKDRFFLFEVLFEESPEDPGSIGKVIKGNLTFIIRPHDSGLKLPSEL